MTRNGPAETGAQRGKRSPSARVPAGRVKLSTWQDKIQIGGLAGKVPVWLCGWRRDPDTERAGTTVVVWRYTEAEIPSLHVS